MIACSLRNASAAAGYISRIGQDVTIICAGTEGRISKDDLYCAGVLVAHLLSPGAVGELTDGGRVAVEWYLARQGRSHYVLSSSQHGQRLVALGFGDDLRFCADDDASDVVPVLDGSRFVPLRGDC